MDQERPTIKQIIDRNTEQGNPAIYHFDFQTRTATLVQPKIVERLYSTDYVLPSLQANDDVNTKPDEQNSP